MTTSTATTTTPTMLPGGWILTRHVPAATALSALRQQAVGAQLYVLTGSHTRHDLHAFYAGLSNDLDDTRAATSYTTWATRVRAIEPSAVLLLHHGQQQPLPALRYAENEIIRRLSLNYLALNTHSSCGLQRAHTTRPQRLAAIRLADAVTAYVCEHEFAGQTNPPTVLAGNNRESFVRITRAADRALDSFEIARRALRAGVPCSGNSIDFTVRRDLAIRERDGVPRVYTCTVGHRKLFYGPHLTKQIAINGYLRAHRWSDLHSAA